MSFVPKMKRWSEFDTVKFVKLYCSHENLWDVSNPDYKNNQARLESFQQVVKEMRIAGFSITDARQKVKSLRNTYCQELKKIQQSNKEYTPTLKWFDIMDSAMRRRQLIYNSSNSANGVSEQKGYVNDAFEDNDEPLDDGTIFEEDPFQVPVSPAVNHPSPMEHSLTVSSTDQCSVPSTSTSHSRKRRREGSPDEIVGMQNWNYSRQPTRSEEDEFDAFGRYVAQSLKNMPVHLAIQCQSDLQASLTRFRMMSLVQTPSRGLLSPPNAPTEVRDSRETQRRSTNTEGNECHSAPHLLEPMVSIVKTEWLDAVSTEGFNNGN